MRHDLHTGLSGLVIDQGQFPEVIPLMVLQNHIGPSSILHLLGHQLALQYDIKLIPDLPLLEYIVILLVLLLLQDVDQVVPTLDIANFWSVGMHFRSQTLSIAFFIIICLRRAATFRMWLKIERSNESSLPGLLLSTEAARVELYIRDSSPKESPGLQVVRKVFSPLTSLQQSNSPSDTMQKWLPDSPSFTTTSYSSVYLIIMAFMMISSSLLSRFWKRMELSIYAFMSYFSFWQRLSTSVSSSSARSLYSPKTSSELPILRWMVCFFLGVLVTVRSLTSSLPSSSTSDSMTCLDLYLWFLS